MISHVAKALTSRPRLRNRLLPPHFWKILPPDRVTCRLWSWRSTWSKSIRSTYLLTGSGISGLVLICLRWDHLLDYPAVLPLFQHQCKVNISHSLHHVEGKFLTMDRGHQHGEIRVHLCSKMFSFTFGQLSQPLGILDKFFQGHPGWICGECIDLCVWGKRKDSDWMK